MKLHCQLLGAAPNYYDAVEIYTRETIPERYHFSNNNHVAMCDSQDGLGDR